MEQFLRTRPHIVVFGVLLGVIVIYWTSLWFGCISDDYTVIGAAQPEHFHVLNAFPAGSGQYFRPLTMLSYAMLSWVTDGFFHQHVINLSLHLCASFLVWRIAQQIADPKWALMATALFAFHPAHVTNVVWLSGRADLLCALFLLSMISTSMNSESGIGKHMALSLFALLACASKEVGIMSTPVLFCWLMFRTKIAVTWRLLIGPICVTMIWSTFVWNQFYDGAPASSFDPLTLSSLTLKWVYLVLSPFSAHFTKINFARFAVLALFIVAVLAWLTWSARKNTLRFSLVWPLLIAPLLAVLPVFVYVNGISDRLVTISIALVAPTIGYLLQWFAESRARTVWALSICCCVSYFVASMVGVHTWHRGKAIERLASQSFLDYKNTLSAHKQPVLLTWPGSFKSAPIFSNDIAAGLHFAEWRNYDWRSPPIVVAMVDSDIENPSISWRRLDSRRFLLALEADQGHFNFGRLNQSLGSSLKVGDWEMSVRALNGYGQVSECLITFDPSFDYSRFEFLIWSAGKWHKVSH